MKPRAFKVHVKHPEVTLDPRTTRFMSLLCQGMPAREGPCSGRSGSLVWLSASFSQHCVPTDLLLTNQRVLTNTRLSRKSQKCSISDTTWRQLYRLLQQVWTHVTKVGLQWREKTIGGTIHEADGQPTQEKRCKVTWQTHCCSILWAMLILMCSQIDFPPSMPTGLQVYNPPHCLSVQKRESLAVQR